MFFVEFLVTIKRRPTESLLLIDFRSSGSSTVEAGRRVHQGPERFCPYAPSAWSKGISLPESYSAYSPATSQFITKVFFMMSNFTLNYIKQYRQYRDA